MRRFSIFFLIAGVLMSGGAYAGRDTLTQISTIDALMTGIYDGETTLEALKKSGDFGLGTFNGLDGEMVLLDGVVYRITSQGSIEIPDTATKTPFAAVTYFEPDRVIPLEAGLEYRSFVTKIDKALPTHNTFYAIKITGVFQSVKTQKRATQEKPYKMLTEVVKTQPVFDLKDIRGTIVGFRCPPYVKGINVPGYHLHFLSEDRKTGGHVLDFKVEKATVEIDETGEFTLILPTDKAFLDADLSSDMEKELKAVEK